VKLMTALKVLALAALSVVSGCSTTEYINVTPECTPPPQPTLPLIDQGELWDSLGDERYRELDRYLNTLWGMYDESRAMLVELCGRSNRELNP
jgi:hypothetical protein